MTERSYPVVNKPLSETDWQGIQIVNGNGVIDQGGWPYLLTNIDSATNTVTVAVDQKTGKNKAYLSGFIHEITHAQTLSIPGVTATTTYVVGLVYDPALNTTEAGPISLKVWTDPGDYLGGKTRLELYRITREPNVELTGSTILEIRPRVSHIEVVNTFEQLPRGEDTLIETLAVTRDKGEFYRLEKVAADNTLQWKKINEATGTHLPTPNTVAKRAANGGFRVEVGTDPKDVINRTYLDNALGGLGWVAATWDTIPEAVVRRGADGAFLTEANVGNAKSVMNRGASDTRYAYKSHNHNGSDIISRVPFEHVDGSTHAHNTAWNGTGSIRSTHTTSIGEFCYYSSTIRHKTNVEQWDVDPREALAVEPVEFDRLNPETGEPTGYHDYGVIAEQGNEHLPMFVERDPDGTISGWSYERWTTAHQVVLRFLDDRATTLESEVETLKEENATLKANYDDLLARVSKLEGNV